LKNFTVPIATEFSSHRFARHGAARDTTAYPDGGVIPGFACATSEPPTAVDRDPGLGEGCRMDDERSRRRSRNVAIEHLRDDDRIVLLDRSSDPEPWIALAAIRDLRDHLEEAERRAVVAALAEGASWGRIGHALGCSHQRAASKHRDDRATAIDRHPSVPEPSPTDPRMRLLTGGLDPFGFVLPDGRWVALADLTPHDRAEIADHRSRLTAVPVLDDEGPGTH
jgi:hypothetical protein